MTEAAGVRIRIGARQLSRRFGPVVAVDRVDLGVAPGTIHAVVGGNGAGKSTLMRILQGVDRPDEGSVILNDAPVRLTGPADAFARGIGMVHQEFMLAPPLTLLENLILAHEPLGRGGLIDWRAARAEAERLAKIAGVAIDWRSRVSDAPVHVRQVLEILRLLYRGVEVMRAADAITVMRAGRVVATTTPAETDKARLARAMVGEAVEPARIETRSRRTAAPLFAAKGLVARDPAGIQRLGPIDLEVHAGEIVGVAGVSGNGQDELVASAAGLRPIASGTIVFAGTPITNASTGRFRSAGIGYLSADRAEEGLCLVASIRDNFVAGREGEPPFSRRGLLRPAAIHDRAKSAMAKLSVRYRRLTDAARSLSGGNQQRVVIAREFDREPKLLVATQPTRGVDISGIAFIHQRIAEFRDREGAVLLISEEIDEILALSDRIIGLYGGVVVGELGRGEASVENVGRMMLGQKAA